MSELTQQEAAEDYSTVREALDEGIEPSSSRTAAITALNRLVSELEKARLSSRLASSRRARSAMTYCRKPSRSYEDEAVTLYHGDCRDVLPLPADVTLTDPPYNVGKVYGVHTDAIEDYAAWTTAWVALVPRPLVVTPGTVNLEMWLSHIGWPRWIMIWYKPSQVSPSALNGWNVWEPILLYGRHRKPIGHDVLAVRASSGHQRDAEPHPCPKDLNSWRVLLERVSLPGDVLLDPFAGSGTTLRAAKDLGRKAIGIEIEERYCEIAARRLSQEVLAL